MDDYGRRSSYDQSNMQLDLYHGNTNNNNNSRNSFDMRSYSLNSYTHQNHNSNSLDTQLPYDFGHKLQKSKTTAGISSKVWCFSDPEFKRKKRVASYRALTVEGKVKGSFKKSFRWFKETLLYGWW